MQQFDKFDKNLIIFERHFFHPQISWNLPQVRETSAPSKIRDDRRKGYRARYTEGAIVRDVSDSE